MIQSTYDSPLGKLILLANKNHLLGLWFAGQTYEGAKYDLKNVESGKSPVLTQVANWLDQYFAGQQPAVENLPLAPDTTPFRKQVLQILIQTPYGKTITYQEIVDRLTKLNGKKTGSARAVGGAVGHNPISIIIPCHRVVGSDGSLTGYAGSLERKKALLGLEQGVKIPQLAYTM